MKPQFYTKCYGPLRNAQSGRDRLEQGEYDQAEARCFLSLTDYVQVFDFLYVVEVRLYPC